MRLLLKWVISSPFLAPWPMTRLVPLYSATQVMTTSVGIKTAPQTDPGYVLVEVLVQGTGGVPDPAFPQEAGVRTRVEGFSTDPFRAVDVSAIDQDCNGNLIFRQPAWASNFPVEPGPPGIGVVGRWRARFPQGGDFLPASAERWRPHQRRPLSASRRTV